MQKMISEFAWRKIAIQLLILLSGVFFTGFFSGHESGLAFFCGSTMMLVNLFFLWLIWAVLQPKNKQSWVGLVMFVKYTTLLGLGFFSIRIWKLNVVWLSVGLFTQILGVALIGLIPGNEMTSKNDEEKNQ